MKNEQNWNVNAQGGAAVGTLASLDGGLLSNVKSTPVTRMVARCQAGDEEAFRALFDRYVNSVHRHLGFLMGPGEDVDDLVQLVFLNVFRSIRKFEGKSAFSTWLYRVTINVARQEIRSRNRFRKLDNAILDVSRVTGTSVRKTPESRLSNHQELHQLLSQLSKKKRETVILYFYEGYSLSEIAEILDSTTSTIGSRLQAGRVALLEKLAVAEEAAETLQSA